jgi:hypothetical protein
MLSHQALLAKRKTWTYWKNVRDGALNYIADMHAKRRHLVSHFKARLLQNAYRAHLTRARQRGLLVAAATDTLQSEESKVGVAFQQKRLPSKYAKRKSVVPPSATSNTAMPTAVITASPAAASSQLAPERVKSVTPHQSSTPVHVPESSPTSSRVRRLSM